VSDADEAMLRDLLARVDRLERAVASSKRTKPTVVVADNGDVFLPGSGWCRDARAS